MRRHRTWVTCRKKRKTVKTRNRRQFTLGQCRERIDRETMKRNLRKKSKEVQWIRGVTKEAARMPREDEGGGYSLLTHGRAERRPSGGHAHWRRSRMRHSRWWSGWWLPPRARGPSMGVS